MDSYFFEIWKEKFGTKGPSKFDIEYETEKLVRFSGRAYSMKEIQLAQRKEYFSIYDYFFGEFPNERKFEGDVFYYEQDEVDLSPYESDVKLCTNKNLKFPIPKRKEIYDILSNNDLTRNLELESLLGLYKPFHLNQKWGIYIFRENLRLKANKIKRNIGNLNFTYREIYDIIFWQTYFHEVYHHKIEMYATRLEFALRKPIYGDIFYKFYCGSKGLDYCLEEALAETYGALKCSEFIANQGTYKKREILDFIKSHVLINRPPGYRVASNILKLSLLQIKQVEYDFLETLSSYVYEELYNEKPVEIEPELYELNSHALSSKLRTPNRFTMLY